MNGRESKLTRVIFSNQENKSKLFERIKSSHSIIGTDFSIEGKKYVITTGSVEKSAEIVSDYKQHLKDEYSYQ